MVERTRNRELYENSPDRMVSIAPDRSVLFANLRARHAAPVGLDVAGHIRCFQLLYGGPSPCVNCGLQPVRRYSRRA